METHEIIYLVLAVLGLLIGGIFWRKFEQALKLLVELGEALRMTADLFDKTAGVLKDRKVTKAEAVLLLKAWQEASAEFVDVYQAIVYLLPASAIKFLFRR